PGKREASGSDRARGEWKIAGEGAGGAFVPTWARMPTFKVAHLREQGQDIIVVLVAREISREQLQALQDCANQAGLRGTVVPVWRSGSSFRFLAPSQWHAFFRSLPWEVILQNINRSLTCA